MKVRYHPEASKEIDEAFDWYEINHPGLGRKFIDEAESAIHRIRNFPHLHPHIFKDVRKAVIPIFPYGIIYSVNEDSIEVYAVAHLHRKPFYWKKKDKRQQALSPKDLFPAKQKNKSLLTIFSGNAV